MAVCLVVGGYDCYCIKECGMYPDFGEISNTESLIFGVSPQKSSHGGGRGNSSCSCGDNWWYGSSCKCGK
ncbi:hypothetical protein MKX03_023492 [Papaver bracteatum]|nr:hypothetical protein MKX03_023492 [Papaver bracteatum]